MTDTAIAWRFGQFLTESLTASAATNPAFEKLHPRGGDGQFIPKPGHGSAWVKMFDSLSGLWTKAEVLDLNDGQKIKIKRLDNGTEELVSRKSLYQTDQPVARLTPTNWKQVGGQAGSNPGGFYKDDKGEKWYVKQLQSKLHVSNENFANRMYRAAGVPTPETAVSPDGKRFMTKIEDSVGWSSYAGTDKDKVLSDLRKNFLVDAWLANWDAPMNSENIRITPDGRALRVDAGGAVMFRARGGQRQLTPNVGEIDSMRATHQGKTLYDGLTFDEQLDGVQRILAISPETIKKMAAEDGLPSHIADSLITRRAWLANTYNLDLPETTDAGKKLLADLNKTPDKLTTAEATKVAKTITPNVVPDKAGALEIGAPVWVKDKGGRAFPDVGVISDIDTNVADGRKYKIKSSKGSKEIWVAAPDFEVLRQNFASEASIYHTGEHVQLGDKVRTKQGEGVVTEVYPLYARVTHTDGTDKVFRVKTMDRLAQVGTHDTKVADSDGVLKSPGAATPSSIGPKADMSDAHTFPKLVYSLPHRAEVLVISYDAASDRAKVAIAMNDLTMRAAWVPGSKLYDPEKINKDAVAALPVRAATVRAQTPVDVSTLEKDKEFSFGGGVKINLDPGDRVIKVKRDGRAPILYIKVKKDGKLEFAGGNHQARRNSGVYFEQKNDGHVGDTYALDPAVILDSFEYGDKLEDVTPGKYDQAAFELADLKPDVSNLKDDANIDLHVRDYFGYSYGHTRTAKEYGVNVKIDHVEPADRYYAMADSTTPPGEKVITNLHIEYETDPKTGYYTYDMNGDRIVKKETIESKIRARPKLYLQRGDDIYDLGLEGEHASDPSKWTKLAADDHDNFKKAANLQEDTYFTPNRGQVEPEVTFNDGRVVKYTDLYPNATNPVNSLAQNLGLLAGKKQPNPRRLRYNSKFNGDRSAVSILPLRVEGWNKGDPNPTISNATASNGSTDGNSDGTDTSPIPLGVLDFSQLKGFKALTSKIDSNRESLSAGEYDTRLHEIMNADYFSTGARGGRFGGSTLGVLPDGSVHGDPFMAQYAQDHGGHENTLVASAPVYKAILDVTGGSMDNWRFVSDASQRDAIKNGAYFNGTGVNGNGSYSGPRTSARQYGSAGAQITRRPGAKVISAVDAWGQSTVDLYGAVNSRHDVLASAIPGLPSSNDLHSIDVAHDHPDVVAELKKHSVGVNTFDQTLIDNAHKKVDDFVKTPEGKATAAWYSYLKTLPGWDVQLSNEDGGYYSNGMKGQIIATSTKDKSVIRMVFGQPDTSGSRYSARQAMAKLDKSKFYSVKINGKNAAGDTITGTSVSSGSYQSGWYIDNFSQILDETGMNLALHKGDAKQAAETKARTSQIDARISFISDPGRWALAAGYDVLFVDGSDFNVFLHRTAFIIKQ